VRKPRTATFKTIVLDAVHAALVTAVPTRRTASIAGRAGRRRFSLRSDFSGPGLTARDPERVMIVLQDVAWENWSPGGGRIPRARASGAILASPSGGRCQERRHAADQSSSFVARAGEPRAPRAVRAARRG